MKKGDVTTPPLKCFQCYSLTGLMRMLNVNV